MIYFLENAQTLIDMHELMMINKDLKDRNDELELRLQAQSERSVSKSRRNLLD